MQKYLFRRLEQIFPIMWQQNCRYYFPQYYGDIFGGRQVDDYCVYNVLKKERDYEIREGEFQCY